jgi:prevent-host-death family protein
MAVQAVVDVAELWQSLPEWLARVRVGDEIVITQQGAPIARLVPHEDRRGEARRLLQALRARANVGDVEAPVGELWEAGDDIS